MPRSGTTLIESIVASAPDTISGGELVSFYDLIKASFEKDEDSVYMRILGQYMKIELNL